MVQFLDRFLYPNFKSSITAFAELVGKKTSKSSWVLDYGAGSGVLPQLNYKGKVAFIAGVDPDEIIKTNANLDEAKIINPPTYRIPYPDNTFDFVFSHSVLEHIENPESTFLEINRVLKPGGSFIGKTPNLWHYVPLFASLTPTSFHEYFGKKVFSREPEDTYPTIYKCNTKRKVQKIASNTNFKVDCIDTWEPRPDYLRFFSLFYIIGFLYERIVNSTKYLGQFRSVLVFTLVKK